MEDEAITAAIRTLLYRCANQQEYVPPGGGQPCGLTMTETADSVKARVKYAINKVVCDSGGRIPFVIAHGGIIREFARQWGVVNTKMKNMGMLGIVVRRDGSSVQAFNLTVHSPNRVLKRQNVVVLDQSQEPLQLEDKDLKNFLKKHTTPKTHKGSKTSWVFVLMRHAISANNALKGKRFFQALMKTVPKGGADPQLMLQDDEEATGQAVAEACGSFGASIRFFVSPMIRTLQTFALIAAAMKPESPSSVEVPQESDGAFDIIEELQEVRKSISDDMIKGRQLELDDIIPSTHPVSVGILHYVKNDEAHTERKCALFSSPNTLTFEPLECVAYTDLDGVLTSILQAIDKESKFALAVNTITRRVKEEENHIPEPIQRNIEDIIKDVEREGQSDVSLLLDLMNYSCRHYVGFPCPVDATKLQLCMYSQGGIHVLHKYKRDNNMCRQYSMPLHDNADAGKKIFQRHCVVSATWYRTFASCGGQHSVFFDFNLKLMMTGFSYPESRAETFDFVAWYSYRAILQNDALFDDLKPKNIAWKKICNLMEIFTACLQYHFRDVLDDNQDHYTNRSNIFVRASGDGSWKREVDKQFLVRKITQDASSSTIAPRFRQECGREFKKQPILSFTATKERGELDGIGFRSKRRVFELFEADALFYLKFSNEGGACKGVAKVNVNELHRALCIASDKNSRGEYHTVPIPVLRHDSSDQDQDQNIWITGPVDLTEELLVKLFVNGERLCDSSYIQIAGQDRVVLEIGRALLQLYEQMTHLNSISPNNAESHLKTPRLAACRFAHARTKEGVALVAHEEDGKKGVLVISDDKDNPGKHDKGVALWTGAGDEPIFYSSSAADSKAFQQMLGIMNEKESMQHTQRAVELTTKGYAD